MKEKTKTQNIENSVTCLEKDNSLNKKQANFNKNSQKLSFEETLISKGIELPKGYIGRNRYTRWGKNQGCFAIRLQDGKGYCYGCYQLDGGEKHYYFENDNNQENHRQEVEIAQAIWLNDKINQQETASKECEETWNSLPTATQHKYLQNKKVKSHGLKLKEDRLIIPIYDVDGKLWSFQYIFEDGSKKFKSNGKKKGCFFTISQEKKINEIENLNEIYVCEGYATGATIYETTKKPVIVTFDAGNIYAVVQNLKQKYPNLTINICADNDRYSQTNTGVEIGQKVSKQFECNLLIPSFKVLETKPTDFNDLYILEGANEVKNQLKKKVKPPQGSPFQKKSSSLYYYNTKKNEYELICDEIDVLAKTYDVEENRAGRIVEFKDKQNKKQQIKLYCEWFAGDAKKAHQELLRIGFEVPSEIRQKRKLNEYIISHQTDKLINCFNKSGWLENNFLTTKKVYGDENNVQHVPLLNPAQISQKKTLKDWQENISKYCINNSKLILAVSAAFAAPILKPCKKDGFLLHFYGRSSQGKTTTLQVGASVYGNNDYIQTWRTTDNALEGIATAHNDLCLFLDEIGECNPKKISAIAYMLANGVGKNRATTSGTPKPPHKWLLNGFSTGEEKIETTIRKSGQKAKAGQLVRILSIPAVEPNNKHGLFEDIHEFTSAIDFVDYLKSASKKYYGTAFEAFIEGITPKYNQLEEVWNVARKEAREKYLPDGASAQDKRVFDSFAICGLAGEIATQLGITNWPQGIAMEAAMKNYNSWLIAKGGVGNLEDKLAMQQVASFFEKYEHSRFELIGASGDDTCGSQPLERAGYRHYRDNGIAFYVFPNYFNETICREYDPAIARKELKRRGIIEADTGEDRFTKKVLVGKKRLRMMVINSKIFELLD